MDLITIDFETYYDKQYSLSKMTTEAYIRDSRFEVIGVSVKVNNGATEWASGTHEEIKRYFTCFNWADSAVVAHNCLFDGAILSWIFDVHPRMWVDTLSMGRALHGVEVGGSLAALANRYNLGVKGNEVVSAMGKTRLDFTDAELDRYGDYCINDVELTYKLLTTMGKHFPKKEMKVVDVTLRMFIDPILDLDLGLLEQHLENIKDIKDKLLEAAQADKKSLMSNPKFAELLEGLGVVPPMKISPTTDKETFAFAKTDEGLKALLEHEDVRVQTLVNARLGNKSTLEETRTQRFIDIYKRGLLPVPIRYYAAHTGRWGGTDKINLQNLPSRGPNGKVLKRSIIAPEGYVVVDCDSSQIEARVLAWLAGQDDLTEAFRAGDDVYKRMAMSIYGSNQLEDVTKDQRFVGKTTILGAGYGMGAPRFKDQLQSFGFDMPLDEARQVIQVYRQVNHNVTTLWKDAGHVLKCMEQGDHTGLGLDGVLDIVPEENAIRLPSGLLMRYGDLSSRQGEMGKEYTYLTRRGRTRIYGGKVVENVCQAIARCIIADQMVKISKRYPVVMTVHDSLGCCVSEDEAEEAKDYMITCMRQTPAWAEGLPLDCEASIGASYGDCL
tara:strand:+ start:1043 stop:2872 length:1830 start_codon:yes stop_codon:yes gene_type:complete